jgi:hypothetical protein
VCVSSRFRSRWQAWGNLDRHADLCTYEHARVCTRVGTFTTLVHAHLAMCACACVCDDMCGQPTRANPFAELVAGLHARGSLLGRKVKNEQSVYP